MKTDLQKLYRYKIHHVIFWIGYFVFYTYSYKTFSPSLPKLFFVTFIYFLFHASTFYTIAYYLFPKYLYAKKYKLFFLITLVLVVVQSIAISLFMYYSFFYKVKPYSESPFLVFMTGVLTIVFVSGILCAGKLVVDKMRTDRSIEKMEQQRIASELQYLKAQVNPHFLFNAINSIYFLIKKDPDQAANTLIRLSDLLRFQLYDCSVEKISIEKEIEYLRNFVSLEQIRKGEKTKIEFHTSEDLQGFEVAPFMLIPFLENTFKYVSSYSGEENKIIVRLWREDHRFNAHFYNTTDNLARIAPGGIGHKNVKRRLELIYPNKHSLNIVERPGSYKVMLTLHVA
ncbi:MAG: histidine kinase [Bacteroidetes bacterium]|nr:histidine kinase [Bacteroidota bacterium]MBS1540511.1 histidine kinase [Bacteroidota bacterium]